MPGRRRIVIAIGGNAIKPPSTPRAGGRPVWELLDQTASQIAQLAQRGDQVVLVHGNGPQVGTLLLAHEAAEGSPALTLDVADAETQGQLGYLIQQTLGNHLRGLDSAWATAGLITQVVVGENDPAFAAPTKPIGPEYSREQVGAFEVEKGWTLREVHPGRWRRVVASPRPLEIVELGAIEALLSAGVIPIVAGGGGIPVTR
ncbi:MAG: carbamate kinase, partial [Chloroflexota bacterium]